MSSCTGNAMRRPHLQFLPHGPVVAPYLTRFRMFTDAGRCFSTVWAHYAMLIVVVIHVNIRGDRT